ncbi:DNA-binding protein [Rhodomicrobium udaipurense JA643]|uniref:Hemolysin III family protein n=1 Tax=Rhodomicrobium udaipurense TaxID=1202716 RepID=A0A8I1GGM4_9HYPH|nr:hemolysin III family protein [Rhodomicrobium udaipurense]KAI95665.1 DNA-binding protein [Rhodomicrobium udaipurense JA643]MBJ7543561.1 hemolysin III family protein [Rhodomicrobium udaipurense]
MKDARPFFPSYTRAEQIADAGVHAAGVTFAAVASVWLLVEAAGAVSGAHLAAVIVYCLGLVAMFSASAAYNLAPERRAKELLRRADHAAIFVMIAGSYTPFAVVVGGGAGIGMLVAVWAIAALGVFVKLRFPRRFDRLCVALYLAQGWIVLAALRPLVRALPEDALTLLVAGGVVYTAGVPFHLMEWMRFHNVIWHVFVLAGAATQFFAIRAAVFPS